MIVNYCEKGWEVITQRAHGLLAMQLEWCDAFSLLICRQLIQPESRAIEISKGPDSEPYELYQLDQSKLTVCPWPFESKKFEIRYEARLIEQMSFGDSADFRKCFYEAAVRETTWIVAAAPAPRKKRKYDTLKRKLDTFVLSSPPNRFFPAPGSKLHNRSGKCIVELENA